MKLKDAYSLEGKLWPIGQHIKNQRHHFPNKGYGFSSSHVWIWELDNKAECWRIDAFELWCWRRLLRVLWTARRANQSVHPKGDQSWVFFGRTNAKAATPILWPPHAKSWLIWKDPNAGKDWGQEEKGWYRMRWLNGITDSMDMGLGHLRELVMNGEAWHTVVHGVRKSWTRLNDWTELNWNFTVISKKNK